MYKSSIKIKLKSQKGLPLQAWWKVCGGHHQMKCRLLCQVSHSGLCRWAVANCISQRRTRRKLHPRPAHSPPTQVLVSKQTKGWKDEKAVPWVRGKCPTSQQQHDFGHPHQWCNKGSWSSSLSGSQTDFWVCHECSQAAALGSVAYSTFRWSVIESWSAIVFLKAINILLCTDFYLHHLDSSSLIKSCDLHKQNCCSLNSANYKN